MQEFKNIYFWEWFHRMWGRSIGVVFLGPLGYFCLRGTVNKNLAKKLGLLGCFGLTQGLIGWWMVKSGLQENNGTYQNLAKGSP